jgi:2-polyprenyl-3-methyl-5-hydroxy-6-metoxy-1,4-benzoquinol methylase
MVSVEFKTFKEDSEQKAFSRYAEIAEISSANFRKINEILNNINSKYGLTDHSELNKTRFPWSQEYLTYPQFYASRLWEYPWAILQSQLEPGLKCADVGCGESPFTVYLKEIGGCHVLGLDPDIHSEENKDNFGVSKLFIKKSGLDIIKSSIDNIESEDSQFDRVFCLSVIEHISNCNVRAKGMREIARILKPGGLAIISVDVNLLMRLSNPLELVWESGLNFYGGVNLTMPEKRLGIFCDEKQPADVFGLVLTKDPSLINVVYGSDSKKIEAWRAAYLRETIPSPEIDALIRYDMNRNLINHRPSLITLLRIATKFLLRKYPGLAGK